MNNYNAIVLYRVYMYIKLNIYIYINFKNSCSDLGLANYY